MRGVSPSKEVVGDVGVVAAHDFEIDLVQVITQKVVRTDDTDASGRLEDHLHFSEHDVEGSFHRDGIALLCDCEFRPIVREGDEIGASGDVEKSGIEFGHGGVEGRFKGCAQGWILWAGFFEGVACRGGLREGGGEEEEKGEEGGQNERHCDCSECVCVLCCKECRTGPAC